MHIKLPTSELANRISRALISASNRFVPTRTWNSKLEQTLHGFSCRDSLSPILVSQVIDPYLINHHSLALGFFNWASQQPGFSHNSMTYQSILKSLSVCRQFNSVDRLLRQMKTHKILVDPSVYRSVIASHIVGKKTQNAFAVFYEVRSSICNIGPDTCNSLVAALSSDGDMSCAQKVLDEMILRGVGLSTIGFGVFVWKFCRNAELNKTLSLLDEVIKLDWGINGSIIALLVVHGLCLESRVQDAMFMLDVLRKRDCKPDFMAYRVVAEALRSAGNVVDMEKVLKMKRKLGVAPRASDYRDYIYELISERLNSEAKELGEVIVNGNFPIEDDVLNALVGSVSADDPCCALMFFNFLVSKERFPTPLTLSNLSRSLCKHGKHDELLEVFEILSAKEYFVDIERYNMMVSFICEAGRVKEAYQVLQEMKKKGLGPDITSYNSIMDACCREDLIRPAKRLWDEMFVNGCKANLKTYNILIRKFSEIGQVKEAHRLFRHMLDKGVAPDATTYAFVLEGLCKENQLETAFEIFKKSFKQDAAIAETVLSKFILCLCKEGQFISASDLLCDYVGYVEPSESHIILLKCLADAGEIPVAIEHVKRVGKMSHQMLPALLAELASLLSSSSKPEHLLELIHVIETLQQNPSLQIVPGRISQTNLLLCDGR